MTQPSFTRRLLGEDGRPIALLLVYGDATEAYELLRECQTALDAELRSEARRLARQEGKA